MEVTTLRFEETNSSVVKFFRWLGLITVYWKSGHYEVSKLHFCASYIAWFILPTASVMVAPFGRSFLEGDTENGEEYETDMSQVMYIVCIAVVPSFQAFSIRTLARHLPDIFTKMGEIDYKFGKQRKEIKMSKVLVPYIRVHDEDNNSDTII